jgi:CubicO group peptidase (beta-lactamase class C family)
MMKHFLMAVLLVLGLANAQSRFDFEAAAAYSKATQGDAVLVLHDGKIVFETYQNGYAATMPHLLASGTKSFSGALLVAAIEDGLVRGFDELVSETILEWRDSTKASITLRQLLSLTSGIEGGQAGNVSSYQEAIEGRLFRAPNTTFIYGQFPFQIFGEVLRRKLEKQKLSVAQYLAQRILAPIGLKVGFWNKFLTGEPNLPSGAHLTATEWAKFGQLMLQNGKWGNRQVLRADLLSQLFIGSSINPAYGMTFWLNAPGIGVGINTDFSNGIAPFAPDLVMAAGGGNQRLYILPSERLVVVRFGRDTPYSDAEFLKRLLRR